jgi:hypothetical protein
MLSIFGTNKPLRAQRRHILWLLPNLRRPSLDKSQRAQSSYALRVVFIFRGSFTCFDCPNISNLFNISNISNIFTIRKFLRTQRSHVIYMLAILRFFGPLKLLRAQRRRISWLLSIFRVTFSCLFIDRLDPTRLMPTYSTVTSIVRYLRPTICTFLQG